MYELKSLHDHFPFRVSTYSAAAACTAALLLYAADNDGWLGVDRLWVSACGCAKSVA